MNKMLFLLSFLLPLVSAHMTMVEPPALALKSNSFTAENDVDYSLSSPLSTMADFPCKGHLKLLGTPSGQSVATWAAGSSQSFSLEAGAPHGGGSCQASISEDQGKTWRVIQSYTGGCPSTASTTVSESFTVPKNTMNGDVIFGWTWFNFEGNREMYMNCAVVTITGGGSSPGLSSLPETFVANIGNGCTVSANTNVAFPNPGANNLITSPGTPPVGTCGTAGGSGSGSGSGSGADTPAVSGAPVATSAAAATSVAATSVAAAVPIASSHGANNGLHPSSVTYNNGLYTPPAATTSKPVAAVPTPASSTLLAPVASSTLLAPVASEPVISPVSSIIPSPPVHYGTHTGTVATATASPLYGAPATDDGTASTPAVAPSPSETAAAPDCKRSVRYTRSLPKVVPRQPGCMCQCSGGGVPQFVGQCS